LTKGRLFDGIGHHGSLGLLIHSIFGVGFAAVLVNKGFDSALFNGILIAVEGVTGKSDVRQALDTLPSSSARFNNPILCL
jgi:hypothetical protein